MSQLTLPFSSKLTPYEKEWCECTVEYSEDGIYGNSTEMTYLGTGKFQCPKCGRIEDMSKDTYKVRLQFIKGTSTPLGEYMCVEVLEPIFDQRLNGKWDEECTYSIKEILMEDLEMEFEHHDEGIFDCEILYNYYRTTWEYEEYDYNLRILAESQIVGKKEKVQE